MKSEKYFFTEEIASSYKAEEKENGDLVITMVIPKRFKSLALIKMTDLVVTDNEINKYEDK